jgi:hypothetical protein
MTMRRWMVSVTIVALVMVAAIGGARFKRCRDSLVVHAQFNAHLKIAFMSQEANYRKFLEAHERIQKAGEYLHRMSGSDGRAHPNQLVPLLDEQRRIVAGLVRKISYHESLARRYERAARYPWLPVEPDPPEPE